MNQHHINTTSDLETPSYDIVCVTSSYSALGTNMESFWLKQQKYIHNKPAPSQPGYAQELMGPEIRNWKMLAV